mmetsp:Transcript_5828/g.11977  ORF Transcript_5828/g.11977 Transcript_5828/m.11977 type:complete len:247 (-) Transcript_5828:931-1671(-)
MAGYRAVFDPDLRHMQHIQPLASAVHAQRILNFQQDAVLGKESCRFERLHRGVTLGFAPARAEPPESLQEIPEGSAPKPFEPGSPPSCTASASASSQTGCHCGSWKLSEALTSAHTSQEARTWSGSLPSGRQHTGGDDKGPPSGNASLDFERPPRISGLWRPWGLSRIDSSSPESRALALDLVVRHCSPGPGCCEGSCTEHFWIDLNLYPVSGPALQRPHLAAGSATASAMWHRVAFFGTSVWQHP